MKKKRASSGSAAHAGGNPHVFAALRKRQAGGRVMKTAGPVGGGLSAPRLDRPARKSGGRVEPAD